MGRQRFTPWLRARVLLGLLLWPLLTPSHAAAQTQFTLQVTREASSGTAPPQGSVTSAPAGINCGTACAGQFESDTQVTLTAVDSAPWIFVRWAQGGACADDTSRTCVVDMISNRSARAIFANIDPVPLVLQSYAWSCYILHGPSAYYCDHVPDPGAGFAVLHKEHRQDYSEPYPVGFSSIILDGLVNTQGAAGGLSSVQAKVDAEATSQYASRGNQSVNSHTVGSYLVASNTLPIGTPVSVRATFHVNLRYTLNVTLNEPYVQWGVGWPAVYARVEAGPASQLLILERPPVNYFEPFNETRVETVDLNIESAVGQSIPFAIDLNADNTSILVARARILGDASAQVSGPHFTITGTGVVVEELAISSLTYPTHDAWTRTVSTFDGNPLKLEARVRNYSATSRTVVVNFARSDGASIVGAIPSTPVSVTVPAHGTALASINLPSDGLSRDTQGRTRLNPIYFTSSIPGSSTSAGVRVKPRPIFLFNGIWSGPSTWDRVVLDARARPDGGFLEVVPVPGLLTSELKYSPTVPYNTIEQNADIAHAFIQERRASLNFWKYYLVGHSMGGLMIRQYLQKYNHPFVPVYPTPLAGAEVERIFTIGTPYLGSKCADTMVHVRDDVRELTTDFQRKFNERLQFSRFSSSLAAFSTPPISPDDQICGETGDSDGVVSQASATINGTIPNRHLRDLLDLNPYHIFQTGADKMFDLGIAPNTIGPPTPPAQAITKPEARVAAMSEAASSEWNAGSGSAVLPQTGGCAASEFVRVPSGNVTLSLLSDGAGAAAITSPAGVATETPVAPLFSGTKFTPSQAGTWSLQLCSANEGASFADWSAMVTDTPYTHEISDVLFSGGNQLIPVRVNVAAGAPLPLSASYVLSNPSQERTGSLPLLELLQSGATVPIDSSVFGDDSYLQLEIAITLPDGVVLRTISTVANQAIFASSFE